MLQNLRFKKGENPLQQLARGLILGLVVLAAFLAVKVVKLMWPACLLFAVAGLVHLVARGYVQRRDSKVAAAVAKVTFPYVCGLAGVAVLQLAFNLWRSSADSVADVEEWIIRQSDRIELLTRLSWWEYVGILAVLAAIGLAAPRLRLLRRFVGAVSFVEAVSGVLATVTAFTFVTAAVGAHYLEDSEAHFRARLAEKVRERRQVMADTMAKQAVAESLARLPPVSVSILAAVEARLHASPARAATDDLLDLELGDRIRPEERPPAPPSLAPSAPAGDEARGSELLRQPAEEARRKAEAEGENKAAGEAVEAGLDRVADSASDAVRGHVRDVLEHALGEGLTPLLGAMIDLGDKFTSEYMAQLREPLMKKANEYCDRLADRIGRLGRPENAASAVRARARADALDEAVRIEDQKPGNEEFERLGRGILAGDFSRPAARTAVLTAAIDVAVNLTPGAPRVDWGKVLPAAAGAKVAAAPGKISLEPEHPFPASNASQPTPPAAFGDPVLERAVQGVARYQELEMVRLAEIREWARTKSQAGGEGPPELEHERAVVEPHGVP